MRMKNYLVYPALALSLAGNALLFSRGPEVVEKTKEKVVCAQGFVFNRCC